MCSPPRQAAAVMNGDGLSHFNSVTHTLHLHHDHQRHLLSSVKLQLKLLILSLFMTFDLNRNPDMKKVDGESFSLLYLWIKCVYFSQVLRVRLSCLSFIDFVSDLQTQSHTYKI